MNTALDRIAAVLDKIKTKSQEAQGAGQDTTALNAAIANADTAITNARSAVQTQSQKAYTSNISSGSADLKSPISQMFQQFRADMLNTHNLVLEAKKAVVTAAQELAKLKGETPTATGSATQP